MLVLVTVIIAAGVTLPMTTEAGRQAALDNNVRQMENFGMQVTDEMYANMAKGMRFATYQTFVSVLVFGPVVSVVIAGILWRVFTVLMGGQATFKQLFAVYVHSSVISAAGQLFTGPLNYFRGSMSSATNLAVFLPMIDETLVHRPAARHDRPVHHLVVRAARHRSWCVVPAPDAAHRDWPLRPLRGDHRRARRGHERVWEIELTRNKKILIGVGVVVVLGAIAYANFRFKRVEGITVHTEAIQKRDLKAIVSASGKIQPKRFVNISADTSGRVTDLAVEEGERVKQGQFLLQIDPRNLRTRVQSGEASLGAARSQLEQMRLSLESARTALKQAEDAFRRQQNLAKGGLTTKETLERAENDLAMRKADLAAQEQNLRTLQLRTEQEQATLENARTDLSKVRIESPIDGIITRRNIEQGETAVVGTMNNAGTVLLQVADMSVIEAEVEVDETDIPNVQLGQTATITVDAISGKTFTAQGDRDRQQPDSGDRLRRDAGHQLQGDADGRGRDSGRQARLHLHRRHHDGHPRPGAGRADPGDDGPRGRGRRQGAGRAGAGDRGDGGRRRPPSRRRS